MTQAILQAMGIDIWLPREPLTKAKPVAAAIEPEASIEPVKKMKINKTPRPASVVLNYDTLLLLRDCQSASVLWVFSDTAAWKAFPVAVKRMLRTLLQSTKFRREEIAPVLLANSGEDASGGSAQEFLAEQVEGLSATQLIVHAPLGDALEYIGLPCCVLPSPEAIAQTPEARKLAYDALEKAGLLSS